MSKRPLLPPKLLREVHDAALLANLDREELLCNLDPRFRAGLRKAASPAGQLFEDLAALNGIPALADGSVPLRVWLETARHRSSLLPQRTVFDGALNSLNMDPGPLVSVAATTAGSATPSGALPAASGHSGDLEATRADVVIISALKEEYDEARNVDAGATDKWYVDQQRLGFEVAFRTYAASDGRPVRVALTWVPKMRAIATADTAGLLLSATGARCLAMSGVCAGRRGAVSPGDVIIGNLLYTYDTGAVRTEYDEHGSGSSRFQSEPDPYRLEARWLHYAQGFRPPEDASWIAERPATLSAQGDWVLERLNAGDDPSAHVDVALCCPAWSLCIERLERMKYVALNARAPFISLTAAGRSYISKVLVLGRGVRPASPGWRSHVAPIATGNNVMRDPQLFNRLSESMRTVLGVDMEAAAIAAVAETRKLRWLVMKGVMDHADHDKDDQVKRFAARASAECLLAFLREKFADFESLKMPLASGKP